MGKFCMGYSRKVKTQSMQDEQAPMPKKDAQTLATRTQQLMKNLRSVWVRLRDPSSEVFPRILQSLPNEYQMMGREVIAERLANNVKLHFLDVVATFHEKAEEEGIDIEEFGETLEDAKWSAARLMQIGKS